MARKGISYKDVAEAAKAVKARGDKLTIMAIRAELGNEGSFSTISQHLATWIENEDKVEIIEQVPENVEKVLIGSMMQIWEAAKREANLETHRIKLEFEEFQKSSDQINEAVIKQNKELEAQNEKLDSEIQKLDAELKIAEKKLNAVNIELDTTKKIFESITTKQPIEKKASDTTTARPSKKVTAPEKTQA